MGADDYVSKPFLFQRTLRSYPRGAPQKRQTAFGQQARISKRVARPNHVYAFNAKRKHQPHRQGIRAFEIPVRIPQLRCDKGKSYPQSMGTQQRVRIQQSRSVYVFLRKKLTHLGRKFHDRICARSRIQTLPIQNVKFKARTSRLLICAKTTFIA